MNYISLLFPNKCESELICSTEDIKVLLGSYMNSPQTDISKYMTSKTDVIMYRQSLFLDLLNCQAIASAFEQILSKLEIINDLAKIKENSSDIDGQLCSIKLIDTYIDWIEFNYKVLKNNEKHIISDSLNRYYNEITSIKNSEEYTQLLLETENLSKNLLSLQSITIGMNLNEYFFPYECGIVSVNCDKFSSSNIANKLVRKNSQNDLLTITPLKVSSSILTKDEKKFADMAIHNGLSKIFKTSVKDWEPTIKKFFWDKVKIFLPLIEEFKFILFSLDILFELKEKKLPLSCPTIAPIESKIFSVNGIYNPIMAKKCTKTILNDFEFDEMGQIYILTGANSGGKTVFTSAVGICQFFVQLGLLLPCRDATISPVEHIYVCYTNGSSNGSSFYGGRLEDECIRVKNIFQKISKYDLVLMDEVFSSTSSFEAAYIARDVIDAFSTIGCRVIFSTHIHELIDLKDEINAKPECLSQIDTLTSVVDCNGNKTYKIKRIRPDGKSYADAISSKYGLTYDELILRKT